MALPIKGKIPSAATVRTLGFVRKAPGSFVGFLGSIVDSAGSFVDFLGSFAGSGAEMAHLMRHKESLWRV
jgi:hypothetical protein